MIRFYADDDELGPVKAHTEQSPNIAPNSWTCGCGWTNGINLARCARCNRKPGYDWETREDNPCTQQ